MSYRLIIVFTQSNQYLLMQSSNVPAKTKAINKSKKDKRILRKKLVDQEERENDQQNDEEDSSEDDIDESEEETESEINTPSSSANLLTPSSEEFTESSLTECNPASSIESSEMIVQDQTNSDSKSGDKQNNAPSFYIGQDQIEQQPEAKSSSSSSSGSSGSSSDDDIDIGDEDIMGFVEGEYEEDEFYDIDDSDDDDEFDIETEIDMQSEKLRSSIEEAKIKAMMEKSLPSPFGAQNIISEMYKMNWYNEVNHRYLTNLMQQKAKQPSEKRLFFDDVVIVKTFKKQQQPNEVPIKMQRFEGLNMNQKNPTHRLMAQQRLWNQLKNNPSAHAMFDQHVKQTVKIHNSNQAKFPLNLGALNRNFYDHSKKPMLLRSQLKPPQKQAEVKPISIAEVLQYRKIEIISDNLPNKGQDSTLLEGGSDKVVVNEVEADSVHSVNAMQQERRAINSDQIGKTQSQVGVQGERSQFNIEDECKVDAVCEPFKQSIIDKVLVDS